LEAEISKKQQKMYTLVYPDPLFTLLNGLANKVVASSSFIGHPGFPKKGHAT
jgi:hypothetical protein